MTRREFFGLAVRGGIAAGSLAGVAALGLRSDRGCKLSNPCQDCGLVKRCDDPKAVAARQAPKGGANGQRT